MSEWNDALEHAKRQFQQELYCAEMNRAGAWLPQITQARADTQVAVLRDAVKALEAMKRRPLPEPPSSVPASEGREK